MGDGPRVAAPALARGDSAKLGILDAHPAAVAEAVLNEGCSPVPDNDLRFTGHELSILITADCPVDTNASAIGQLIADAVTAATLSMVATVALILDIVDPPQDPELLADLDVIDPGGRHTQPPRRQLSYTVTLYADPNTIADDSTDLITAAYQAIAVQIDAAHTGTITSSVMPLERDRHQHLTNQAIKRFRTRAPQD